MVVSLIWNHPVLKERDKHLITEPTSSPLFWLPCPEDGDNKMLREKLNCEMNGVENRL